MNVVWKVTKIMETNVSHGRMNVVCQSEGFDLNECCPRCGSRHIYLRDTSQKHGVLSFLLSFPVIIFGKQYVCRTCGRKWKPVPKEKSEC